MPSSCENDGGWISALSSPFFSSLPFQFNLTFFLFTFSIIFISLWLLPRRKELAIQCNLLHTVEILDIALFVFFYKMNFLGLNLLRLILHHHHLWFQYPFHLLRVSSCHAKYFDSQVFFFWLLFGSFFGIKKETKEQ